MLLNITEVEINVLLILDAHMGYLTSSEIVPKMVIQTSEMKQILNNLLEVGFIASAKNLSDPTEYCITMSGREYLKKQKESL